MTYKLERFGSVFLPVVEAAPDIGTGPSRISVMELPGGGLFDNLGTVRAERSQTSIPLQAVLIGTSLDDLQDQLAVYRGLRGTRDKLWRRMPDGWLHWCYARLDGLQAVKDPRRRLSQIINLNWVMISRIWNGNHHGEGWTLDASPPVYLDDGYIFDEATGVVFTLDSENEFFTLTNSGNAIVKNVIIRITNPGGGDSDITEIHVLNLTTGFLAELAYTNTLPIGHQMKIDCGNWSVLDGYGAPDWDHMALGTSHAVDDLFQLAPGDNSIQVALTGGIGSPPAAPFPEISFEFCDGWE
jgi:hypothetical protein